MFSSGYFFQCMASHPVCCPIVARFLLPSFGVWFCSSICVWPRFLSQGTCCVALATSSLPGRNKKKKKTYKIQQKCEQQDQRNWTIFQLFRRVHSTGAACWDFFCFFIPPASLAGKLLCWQLQPTKKSILYIKKKKEKRNQVRATTSPAESTALQLMDATVATVLLDNPPLKEAQKIMLKWWRKA